MKCITPDLLAAFRRKPCCENCGRRCRPDPHHIFARGMGGGGRLDIPENLIALDRTCHDLVHQGRIKRDHLLAIVARREGKTVEQILDTIWTLRRTSK